MGTFRRLFAVAALAGLIAGVLVTVVHQIATVPVILDAEVFEQSAGAEPGSEAAAPAGTAAAGHDHEHEAQPWGPRDGFERTAYTALADILTGIGFALLLVTAYVVKGDSLDWRKGLRWGLAGFAALTLAPGLGLPPEVPGTESAPLLARQTWWIATAVSTSAGLALIFFGRQPLPSLLGVALIVLPHAYGAPASATAASAAPEALEHRFVVAVTVTSLLFWLSLGTLTGFFYERIFKED